MFNLFRFVKQQIVPSYLGVDIGTTSIKAVEVEQGKTRPRILNYGVLESQSSLTRANAAFRTSTLKMFDQEIIDVLKMLLVKMKPKATEVIASIPPFAVFMTVLDFPEMNPAELEKSIAFQAKQYVPLPLSEVAIDWLKVGEYQDENGFKHQQLLLISVPQEQIKRYQRVFQGVGLSLKSLEIEGLSLIRALVGADRTPTLIIDIGSRSTGIIIVDGGQLKFSGQTDFAGASLTQSLASSLSINPLRAEELKKERGIMGTGPNYELSTIMTPFLDVIIGEVGKVQFNYSAQFPNAPKPERVIVAGGGANLLGVEKYFERELGLPVVKAAPFSKFEYPPLVESLVPELNSTLSVALGLALKEFA